MRNTRLYNLCGIRRIGITFAVFLIAFLPARCGKHSAGPEEHGDRDTLDLLDPDDISIRPARESITFSWESDDSLTYALYWSESPGISKDDKSIPGITSPYTHRELEKDHTYYYRLAVRDGSGTFFISEELEVTTLDEGVISEIVNLYASGGDQKVVLFWSDLSEPVNAVVYWSKNSGFSRENCERMVVHENPYNHCGLLNDITYYYRVAFIRNGTEGDWSEQVEAYTRAASDIPAFPTNVKVQERNTRLTISWTPDGSATHYYVYWARSSGVDKNCSREKSLSNVLHFSNLENETTYYLRVSAENSRGEGQMSEEVSGTPNPLEPPELETEPGYHSVTLSWDSVLKGASYMLTTMNDSEGVDTFNNVQSPFIHDDLIVGGGVYRYSIFTINLDGTSKPHKTSETPLGLDAPERPSADTSNYREIKVSWGRVKFGDSFVLYWDTITVTAESAHKIDMGSKISYTHRDLVPHREYLYRVRSVNGTDTSAFSPERVCSAKGLPAPKLRLISGYRTVTVDLESAYTMPEGRESPVRFNLYWSDSWNGEDAPSVWSRATARLIGNEELPYTLTNLGINQPVHVCLGVVDGEFESDLTGIQKTNALDLSPPDSFRIANEQYKELRLQWKNAANAKSYVIYWSTGDSVTKSSEKFEADSSPFVHTGLAAGTEYRYCITSVDDSGSESRLSSVRMAVVGALSPPTTVSLQPGVTSIALSWSSSAFASSYNVYWSTADDISLSSEKFSCGRTDTVHDGLVPGTAYHYAVACVNGADESGLSAVHTTTTAALLPPTRISTSSDYRSVHLTWNMAQNAESYNVYYSENSTVDTASPHRSVTGDSIHITGLSPKIYYYFKIASVNGIRQSRLSDSVREVSAGLSIPYPVKNIAGYGQNTLYWPKILHAESYIVRWTDGNYNTDPLYEASVNDTFFIHSDLVPHKGYWYSVTAARGEDRGNPTDWVRFVAGGLVAPTAPAVGDTYKGNSIRWNRVNYATSYTLYWSDTLLSVGTPQTISTNDTFYLHENLLADKNYWYRVTSGRDGDESAPSPESVGRTGGLTPPELELSIFESQVRISGKSKFAETICLYWSYEDNVTAESDTLIKKNDKIFYHPFDLTLDAGKTRYYRAVAVRGEDRGEMGPTVSIEL